MDKQHIQLKSFWGVTIDSTLIKQDSDVLAIIIPGIGYTMDRSVMDYSKQLALQFGFDVLPIEFGFHISRDTFDANTQFHIIEKETIEIAKQAIESKSYNKIVLIGKSIGTSIQVLLNKQIPNCKVINIYLTPIDKTVDLGIEPNSLVITGSKDPLITKENVDKIKSIPKVRVITIHGGNHSLESIDDVLKSIHMLKETIFFEKEFLTLHL